MQGGPQDPVEGPPGETAFAAVTSRRRRGPAVVAIAAIVFLGAAVLIKQFASASPAPDAKGTTPAASGGRPSPARPRRRQSPPRRPPRILRPRPDSDAPSNVPRLPGPAGHQRGHLGEASDGERDDVPGTGWEQADAGLYVKPDPADPVGLSIGVYQIEHVNMFPCRWASRPVHGHHTRAQPRD